MPASTTAHIVISAPRAQVMAVIADFPAYPGWARGVRSAEVVQAGPGGRPGQVRFTLDAGIFSDSYVLCYQWHGDAGVRWELARPGSVVTVLTGSYELADRGGATEVSYALTVDLRIPLPGILKRKAEQTIIDTALKGLKNRAEARGGGSR